MLGLVIERLENNLREVSRAHQEVVAVLEAAQSTW